jgi:hypothetical protein
VKRTLGNLLRAIILLNGFSVAYAQGVPQGVAGSQGGAVSIQVDNDSARLQVYDIPPDIVGAVATRLQMDFANNPRVRVAMEPQTNRLLVNSAKKLCS